MGTRRSWAFQEQPHRLPDPHQHSELSAGTLASPMASWSRPVTLGRWRPHTRLLARTARTIHPLALETTRQHLLLPSRRRVPRLFLSDTSLHRRRCPSTSAHSTTTTPRFSWMARTLPSSPMART